MDVAPHTGAPVARIPLRVTPGRAGFGPRPELTFSSTAVASVAGRGWSLTDVPPVQVDHRPGLPRYDGTDSYRCGDAELVPALDGAGDPLVDRVGDHFVAVFGARQETFEVRYERWTHRTTGRCHWRSVASGGVVTVYGAAPAAASRIADPADESRTWSWLPEARYDQHGNAIRYEYRPEDARGVDLTDAAEWARVRSGQVFAQRYLTRIRYGNSLPLRPGDADPVALRWFFALVLDYGDHEQPGPEPDRDWPARGDPWSDRVPGFEVRTWRRCRRLLMFHHLDPLGAAPVLVASHVFGYDEDPAGSLLRSVSRFGHRADGSSAAAPPLRLSYGTLAAELDRSPVGQRPAAHSAPRGARWFDVWGDGLPGLLAQEDAGWYFSRDLGDGRVAATLLADKPSQPARVCLLGDVDGDGQVDAVLPFGRFGGQGSRGSSSAGRWDPVRAYRSTPHLGEAGGRATLLDTDADGRDDLVCGGAGGVTVYPSRGVAGFGAAHGVPAGAATGAAALPGLGSHPATGLFLADMTGDGLPDQVRVGNGRVEYWPGLGHGRFGPVVVMSGAPRLAADADFDPARVRLVDVDGDGRADLVYLGPGEVWSWRNAGGNRFLAGARRSGLPLVDDLTAVDILDPDGDGIPSLVWFAREAGGRAPLRRVRLGEGPVLLTSVTNGTGRETRLGYSTSARHYLRDLRAGRGWRTVLPRHTVVADRLDVRDHVAGTGSVTRYRYHDGVWDGAERRSGFALVDRYDAEDAGEDALEALPTLVRTWFHCGVEATQPTVDSYDGDPLLPFVRPVEVSRAAGAATAPEPLALLAGRELRREVFATGAGDRPSAHPYEVTQTGYLLHVLGPPDPAGRVAARVHQRETLSTVYEQQAGDPRCTRELVLSTDDRGNPTLECVIGVPRRGAGAVLDAQQQAVATAVRRRFSRVESRVRFDTGVLVEERRYAVTGLTATEDATELRRLLTPALAASDQGVPSPGPVRADELSWAQTYYWDDSQASALPLEQVGEPVLIHHTETAWLRVTDVEPVYDGRVGTPMLTTAGYVQRDGYWWARDPVRLHSARAAFFVPAGELRWDGATTTLTWDNPRLVVTGIKDAQDNTVTAEADYHLLVPWRLVDANQNVQESRFDPLGVAVLSTGYGDLLTDAGTTVRHGGQPLSQHTGPAGVTAALADPAATLQGAQTMVAYQTDRADEQTPMTVVVLTREDHVVDDAGAQVAAPRVRVDVRYLDGFARIVQEKLLVEPGEAVTRDADGRVRLDAAGRPVLGPAARRWRVAGPVEFGRREQPVREGEPYFSPTPAYEPDQELRRFGASTTIRYDGLGRPVRADSPDGTHTLAEYRSWSTRLHDADDTVADSVYRLTRAGLDPGEPEHLALQEALAHAGTPVVVDLDPLGREVRLGETAGDGTERHETTLLDADGEVLAEIDARGLTAAGYRRDLSGAVLALRSIDAGPGWLLPDAAGRIVHRWDARGVHVEYDYDGLDRPTAVRVRADDGSAVLVEQLGYGEDPALDRAELRNLRGSLVVHRDPSGQARVTRRDSSGNPLRAERRVCADHLGLPDWGTAVALAAEAHASARSFDAVGRVRREELPDGVVREYRHLRTGDVERVRVRTPGAAQPVDIVDRVELDAYGDRTAALLGNGVALSHRYDPATRRLSRATARRPDAGAGERTLQDLEYTHDPVGNLVLLVDHAQPAAGATAPIRNLTAAARWQYSYDGFYRLWRATGRVHQALLEHDYRPGLPHAGGGKGTRHLSLDNGQAVETYEQQFGYDLAGNLLSLRHVGTSRSWTTTMWVSAAGNRSIAADRPDGVPVTDPESRFDAAGNCVFLAHVQRLEWNYRNTLTRAVIIDRSAAGQPDDAEYYVDDGAGARIRRVTDRLVNPATAVERTEKLSLDGCERTRVTRGAELLLERWTSHLHDGAGSVALLHRWTTDTLGRETDAVPRTAWHYQLGDQLGSSRLELDGQAGVIAYEEFFPYGGTSFIAGNDLREVGMREYRYCGKDRSDATGLYRFEFRYYQPWIGRWLSPDPIGTADSLNLYAFALDNPVTFTDPSGLATVSGSARTRFNPERARQLYAQMLNEVPAGQREQAAPILAEAFRAASAGADVAVRVTVVPGEGGETAVRIDVLTSSGTGDRSPPPRPGTETSLRVTPPRETAGPAPAPGPPAGDPPAADSATPDFAPEAGAAAPEEPSFAEFPESSWDEPEADLLDEPVVEEFPTVPVLTVESGLPPAEDPPPLADPPPAPSDLRVEFGQGMLDEAQDELVDAVLTRVRHALVPGAMAADLAEGMVEAYHAEGGGGWGVLGAVNQLNPVYHLLSTGIAVWEAGRVADDEAGLALELQAAGEYEAAAQHAQQSGRAYAQAIRSAVQLGSMVAGGIAMAKGMKGGGGGGKGGKRPPPELKGKRGSSHEDLTRRSTPFDDIESHHMPAKGLKIFGKQSAKKGGAAATWRTDHQETGSHSVRSKVLKKQYKGMSNRQILAAEFRDLRRVALQEQGARRYYNEAMLQIRDYYRLWPPGRKAFSIPPLAGPRR